MADLVPHAVSSRVSVARALLFAGAALVGMLIATAAALWIHYGSAVFYEMIVAGITACL